MATSSARMMVFVGPIPHGAILSWTSPSWRYAPEPISDPPSLVFLALPSVYHIALACFHFGLALVYLVKDVLKEGDAHGLISSACSFSLWNRLRKG